MSHITIYNKETGAKVGECEGSLTTHIPPEEPQPKVQRFCITAEGAVKVDANCPMARRIKSMEAWRRKQIKKMLWYVTHGHDIALHVTVVYKDSIQHEQLFIIDRPRHLKAMLRQLRFIPDWEPLQLMRIPRYRPNPAWERIFGDNKDLIETTKILLKKLEVDPRLYE